MNSVAEEHYRAETGGSVRHRRTEQIDNYIIRFENGKAVKVEAEKGQEVLYLLPSSVIFKDCCAFVTFEAFFRSYCDAKSRCWSAVGHFFFCLL